MTDEELKKKIIYTLEGMKERVGELHSKYSDDDAKEIENLFLEAGWIDPATCIMPGEFGTPKATEILRANGYVKLAEDQTLPRPNNMRGYPEHIDWKYGQFAMISAGWRKVEQD